MGRKVVVGTVGELGWSLVDSGYGGEMQVADDGSHTRLGVQQVRETQSNWVLHWELSLFVSRT